MTTLDVDELVSITNPGKTFTDARNHPLAPQHYGGVGSFRWLVSGKSGCGKTNLILSCLLQGHIKFDHLYLYVRDPTQDKYVLLIRWLNTIQNEFKKEKGQEISIYTLITDPSKIVPIDDVDSTIVNVAIFDDLLLEKHQEKIVEYFIRGRHRSVDCIYLSQAYHLTDPTIRKNCDYFSIFGVSSKTELIQLAKDHSLTYDYADFKEILRKATEGINNFLFIDRRTTFTILQLRKNFNEIWNEDTRSFEQLNIETSLIDRKQLIDSSSEELE